MKIENKEKNVPEVRFKGFSEAWEQRKLKKIATFNPKALLPEEFEYVDLESVKGTSMVSHKTETKNTAPSRAQRLASNGDVFYQTVRPYQKNNYLFDLPYNNYVFSTGYAQLRPNGDSNFLLNRLQEERFVSNVLNRCTGTSYPAIKTGDLKQIKVSIPSHLDEQRKIGIFFKQFDNTIALHQEKLDRLRQLKKGYLQVMFPEKDEKVPVVRFAGFNENWKKYKLAEVLKVNSGRDYKHLNPGNIPVYGTGGYMLSVNDKLSNENAIGIGRKGTINKPQLLTAPFWTVDTLFFMTALKGFDLLFLYAMTKKINWKKMDESTGVPSLSKTSINNITQHFPSLKEQNEIGLLFQQLDKLISLTQNRINEIKKIKKAYLQKIFV